MAIWNSGASQRESDVGEFQAVALTPIHRESIIRPTHTTIPLRSSQAMFSTGPSGGLRNVTTVSSSMSPPQRTPNHPSARNACQDEEYHGWMNQFCVEPKGDGDTCALGTFVPCALYGKVNWRLHQAAVGEDPLDSSWKSKDGCNGACWLYYCFGIHAGTVFGGEFPFHSVPFSFLYASFARSA